jgi:hypothetical protein
LNAGRHPLARDREPARSGTYLQATAGSQRHFSLAKVFAESSVIKTQISRGYLIERVTTERITPLT